MTMAGEDVAYGRSDVDTIRNTSCNGSHIDSCFSNAGAKKIIQTALDFWELGRDREEIRLYDVETPLTLSVFNDDNSGLWHSSLIDESLVDVFVPFFPLEYRHVVQCVMAEMEAKGLRPNQKTAEEVAKEMSYYPEANELFSVKGCKTIATKLSFYL